MKQLPKLEVYLIVLTLFTLVYHYFLSPPIHEAGHALVCKFFGGEPTITKKESGYITTYITICSGLKKDNLSEILYPLGGLLAELSIPLLIVIYSLLTYKKITEEVELVLLAFIYAIGFDFILSAYIKDFSDVFPLFSNPLVHWFLIGAGLLALVMYRLAKIFEPQIINNRQYP